MNDTTEKSNALNGQLHDLSVKIAVLSAKHTAASATAKKFAEELNDLISQQQAVSRQLRELELHKSGMYMWENIGDGG